MLTVASEKLDGTIVLAAEGELDAYTMRALREALESALEDSATTRSWWTLRR